MKTCFATVVLLIAVSSSAAQTSTACGEAAFPAPVSDLLKAKFARWRPQRVSDLQGYDQEFWSKEHPKECPGIAVGHFEGADSLSYAFLLVPRSEQEGGYQIVVFSKGPNVDAFVWRLLEHGEGKNEFAPVIYKVPPGKYVGFDETKSIRLKLDGVNVEWIEKSSLIYYWWGGRYHKIWTSD